MRREVSWAHGRSTIFALLLTFTVAGCESSTGPSDSPRGSYTLFSWAGQRVPLLIAQAGSDTIEIISGRMEINADGTCSTSVTLRRTSGGNAPTDEDEDRVCTWTLSDGLVSFVFPDGTVEPGEWSGDTVSHASDGVIWVWER